MALSDLATIKQKVRRLTRNPSTAQLTDADLEQYINTFVLYDFPQHVRLFDYKTTLTFYTAPYVDTYSTITTGANTQPLFNFKNKYISVNPPVYVAGFEVLYTQSREQFYGIYPQVNQIFQIGTGNGVTTNFTYTLNNVPFLQNNVTVSSVSTTNAPLIATDVPASPFSGAGTWLNPDTGLALAGSVNYITGAINITFATAPASGTAVNIMTMPYQPARPQTILFFDNDFIVRPVPDQPYPVNIEVFVQPTEIINATQNPELNQFWQYISYGTAKKIFEDHGDTESVETIMAEFKQQERLVLRKTLVLMANERTATIYTNQVASQYGPGWGSGGGQF